MTSPAVMNGKVRISDMPTDASFEPYKTQATITDVQVLDNQEDGSTPIDFHFSYVNNRNEPKSLKKRIYFNPNTFTPEFIDSIKIYKDAEKRLRAAKVDKVARKAEIGEQGWRDLWYYNFNVEQFLLPLFKKAGLEDAEFTSLVGVSTTVQIAADKKGYPTVARTYSR